MVEHWSEKPGVDSSILSLGIFLLLKNPDVYYLGFDYPTDPATNLYCDNNGDDGKDWCKMAGFSD